MTIYYQTDSNNRLINVVSSEDSPGQDYIELTAEQQGQIAASRFGHAVFVCSGGQLQKDQQLESLMIAASEASRIDRELLKNDYMRAFVLALLDEINVLRQAAGLPPRNIEQLKTAITSRI